MRRRSKELNIFSMSALDLFASAMGAFILITLILMPYYLNQSDAPTPDDGFGPQDCPIIEVPQCPVCPTPDPVEAPQCPPITNQIQIADNLLVFVMFWDSESDIDLYVRTPDGEFSYQQDLISGAPGELTKDDTNGGIGTVEVWISQQPTAGDYEIAFDNYTADFPVQVWGSLYKPTGEVVIAPFNLSGSSEPVPVLGFSISNEFEYQETFRGP